MERVLLKSLQSCMLGGLAKECLLTITNLLFFIFLGDKKETHMHTLCVAITKQEAHTCVCANVFSTHLGSCM
jgi:hypothetical protein